MRENTYGEGTEENIDSHMPIHNASRCRVQDPGRVSKTSKGTSHRAFEIRDCKGVKGGEYEDTVRKRALSRE